ncbi:MAG: hypothetical protein ACF8R7_07975 [Phycisphaerales bacterium JB039]
MPLPRWLSSVRTVELRLCALLLLATLCQAGCAGRFLEVENGLQRDVLVIAAIPGRHYFAMDSDPSDRFCVTVRAGEMVRLAPPGHPRADRQFHPAPRIAYRLDGEEDWAYTQLPKGTRMVTLLRAEDGEPVIMLRSGDTVIPERGLPTGAVRTEIGLEPDMGPRSWSPDS